MGLLEQQNLLARLYTDAQLRDGFLENPDPTAAQLGLNKEEAAAIIAILPDEVTFFSRSLVNKRLREVEKLLPLCRKILGEDFARLFEEFAHTHNLKSIRKHLEDAIGFADWLINREGVAPMVRDAARFESTRHRFVSSGRFFSYCLLAHDVRRDLNAKTPSSRRTLVVWFRLGGRVFNYFI